MVIDSQALHDSTLGAIHNILYCGTLDAVSQLKQKAEGPITVDEFDQLFDQCLKLGKQIPSPVAVMDEDSSASMNDARTTLKNVFFPEGDEISQLDPALLERLFDAVKYKCPPLLRHELEILVKIATDTTIKPDVLQAMVERRMSTWSSRFLKSDEECRGAMEFVDIYWHSKQLAKTALPRGSVAVNKVAGHLPVEVIGDPLARLLAACGFFGAGDDGGGGADDSASQITWEGAVVPIVDAMCQVVGSLSAGAVGIVVSAVGSVVASMLASKT